MVEPLTENEKDALLGYSIIPHPDGNPWTKCCGTQGDINCMCLVRKPKNGPSRLDYILDKFSLHFCKPMLSQLLADKARFFCCHRKTEDGFHRECAGWAAKITGNK